MRIAFYEDSNATHLGSIAQMRPVFEVVCGRYSLRERLTKFFHAERWGAFLRSHLAETYREGHPSAAVNDFIWLRDDETLLINGRWLPTADALANIQRDEVGLVNDTVVYLTLDPMEAALLAEDSWDDALHQIARTRGFMQVPGKLANRPWDVVKNNPQQLKDDRDFLAGKTDEQFEHFSGRSRTGDGKPPAIVGPAGEVSIHPNASLDPFVVIDTRQGPVTIDANAQIQAFTRLEGPCHIGRGSQLFRANVRSGTTIGAHCRVGGEVGQSILHSHVNKYHDGFLGHSYVCPWVNLGAMTTNSDLKNDYTPVKVPIAGELIDSHETKVGAFIGDHTKTALGSLFNTGSSIGVMSLVLPGGELLPKHIPSFSRVWHGELMDGWDLQRHLATAEIVMSRRDEILTPATRQLLHFLYDHTKVEREGAILRFRERAQRQPVSG